MSSHSGLWKVQRPSMIARNMYICFRCQNGGHPTNLFTTNIQQKNFQEIHTISETGSNLKIIFYSVSSLKGPILQQMQYAHKSRETNRILQHLEQTIVMSLIIVISLLSVVLNSYQRLYSQCVHDDSTCPPVGSRVNISIHNIITR